MTSMSSHIKMAEHITAPELRKKPTDDFISVLTDADIETPDGTRKLEQHKIITLIAGAGNETVARLMGWAALTLAHNPDQANILVYERPPSPTPSGSCCGTSRRGPRRRGSLGARLHG